LSDEQLIQQGFDSGIFGVVVDEGGNRKHGAPVLLVGGGQPQELFELLIGSL